MGCFKDADNSFETLSLFILTVMCFLRIFVRLNPHQSSGIEMLSDVIYLTPSVGLLVLELFPFLSSWLSVLWPSWWTRRAADNEPDPEEEYARMRILQEVHDQQREEDNENEHEKV